MENPQLDPETAQRTATLIGLSLALGVTAFAGVAWYMQQNASAPRNSNPEFVRIIVYAWIAFTTVSLFAAVAFWRMRVDPLISGRDSLPRNRINELHANLLICWALIESAALLGVTVYFLTGTVWVAAVSVVLIWVAFLVTRPQPDWYQRFR